MGVSGARRLLLIIVLSLVAVAACRTVRVTEEPDSVERPVVERLSATSVRVRWPESFSNGATAVYAGLGPDRIARNRPVAVEQGSSVVLRASDDFPWVRHEYRLYYELVPSGGGPSVVTAERRLPLGGPDNFRDLGGYATVDGRHVRWGRLYRSNELSSLTRRDLEYLSHLGIRLVCDFRSDRERDRDPNRTVGPDAPTQLTLPVDQEGVDPDELRSKILNGGIAALHVDDLMREAYRAFVTDYADEWSAMFQRLADPGSFSTVVHCTAGKDRTGFASALVLMALGVPRETVFEDYLLTNRYREAYAAFVMRWVPLASFFRTRPEQLLPLLEARREYLDVSLATIDARYGSVDAYLEEGLAVTPALRASLRSQLLR